MIWDLLLQLRNTLKAQPASRYVAIRLGDPSACVSASIQIDRIDPETDILIALGSLDSSVAADTVSQLNRPVFIISAPEAFSVSFNQDSRPSLELDTDELAMMQTYLPYALLPCFSKSRQRTFAISHFAQTLDGRIATHNGDSRWIGNQENLTHAHRMRALCDAILIGANTLRHDQPQLTVRHVTGQNPLRVVIGNNTVCQQGKCDNGLLHIHTQTPKGNCSGGCTHLSILTTDNALNCSDILQALFQRGIQSVYIEGGATTTSSFLQQQVIDQVQVHIAPRILGSGLNGFTLGRVDAMNNAMEFRNPRFVPVGDEVMFIGET